MKRNDGFIGQIPFPPKSLVVSSEVREKRQESLQTFLNEASMRDLEERNRSLLQGFLGVSSSGVFATVARYRKGSEGKWLFEIRVRDRNQREGKVEKRYTDFTMLNRSVGFYMKGLILASFPGKLLSNSESGMRERRQGLEDWLTQINCTYPMSQVVESEIFRFLGLTSAGLFDSKQSTKKRRESVKEKEESGGEVGEGEGGGRKVERRASTLKIEATGEDTDHYFDQMMDRVVDGGDLHEDRDSDVGDEGGVMPSWTALHLMSISSAWIPKEGLVGSICPGPWRLRLTLTMMMISSRTLWSVTTTGGGVQRIQRPRMTTHIRFPRAIQCLL